jgi:ankyrin repeat protein
VTASVRIDGAKKNGIDFRPRSVLDALNAGKNSKKGDLIEAATEGRAEMVESLLNAGVEVNATNQIGMTALMVAADRGHNSIAKKLLEHGADVNARDNCNMTALMVAALAGHVDVIKVLLDANADQIACDCKRRAPETCVLQILSRASPFGICRADEEKNRADGERGGRDEQRNGKIVRRRINAEHRAEARERGQISFLE